MIYIVAEQTSINFQHNLFIQFKFSSGFSQFIYKSISRTGVSIISDTFWRYDSLARYISTFEKALLKHTVVLVTRKTYQETIIMQLLSRFFHYTSITSFINFHKHLLTHRCNCYFNQSIQIDILSIAVHLTNDPWV